MMKRDIPDLFVKTIIFLYLKLLTKLMCPVNISRNISFYIAALHGSGSFDLRRLDRVHIWNALALSTLDGSREGRPLQK